MTREILHNGIVLPATWPPKNVDDQTKKPLENPYRYDFQKPDVIPIDVGRQLFVDDFLIESNTTLSRIFNRPKIHPASPVLVPETEEEMDFGNCPMAAPFNDGVWYDPEDNLFKMWYMPGWFHSTALVTSTDGIHWERPQLDVVPGTNLVWPNKDGYDRDGCLVWLDHEAENPNERFKMFQYYRFGKPQNMKGEGWLQVSPDGIHWSDPVVTPPLGDNSSFFYNPFRRKWCMSIRRATKTTKLRARYYHEMDNFLDGGHWDIDNEEVFWLRADDRDGPYTKYPFHKVALYDVNVAPYESLMIGMFAIFRGPENDICAEEGVPKLIDLEVAYSRDGFHFTRPDRMPFLYATREIGDWNRAYLHSAGGVCLVVGDELYIYFTGFSGESPKLGPTEAGQPGRSRRVMYAGASTGLATMRRDGFAGMRTVDGRGVLTTRPVIFQGNRLFVNASAVPHELNLHVSVLTADGEEIEGFSRGLCIPITEDSTCTEVRWQKDSYSESSPDLSSLAGQPVKFRFHLYSGTLYSFWVTDDPDGASYGYMAGGGPGLTKGRDLPT